MTERLSLAATARFEAARTLGARLHGHGFVASVRVQEHGAADALALQARLTRCVGPLDHAYLNERLETPTDAALARWIAKALDVPGAERIAVQSTPDSGAALHGQGGMEAWRRYAFEAAHRLPNVPSGHKCGRMHGHGFEVLLAGREGGYEALDAAWASVAQELQYACLNDLPGLENPTSEVIAAWLWRRLAPALALASVTVCETRSTGARFDGARYRIWKDFSLDAAVRLARAPAGDARRRLHGHTYCLRLVLEAPLDAVQGWVVDYGDVKALFMPVFERLDHQPLDELRGVEDNDCASLARWVMREARALPALAGVELYETPGCGAILERDNA